MKKLPTFKDAQATLKHISAAYGLIAERIYGEAGEAADIDGTIVDGTVASTSDEAWQAFRARFDAYLEAQSEYISIKQAMNIAENALCEALLREMEVNPRLEMAFRINFINRLDRSAIQILSDPTHRYSVIQWAKTYR